MKLELAILSTLLYLVEGNGKEAGEGARKKKLEEKNNEKKKRIRWKLLLCMSDQ